MKINIPKLEAERERIKLSKTEFARLIGMEQSNYIKLCQSESTTIKRLASIGDALHIDPRDLLTR